MQQQSDRFHVQVTMGDDVVEMWATGEIDIATVGVLRAALWAAPARPLLLLDLSGVRLLSAAGVRALLAGHRRVRARGGELVLVDPAPMAARVLHLTGLAQVIPVRESAVAGSPVPAPHALPAPRALSTPRVVAAIGSAPRAVTATSSESRAVASLAPDPAIRARRPLVPVAEASSVPMLACV